MAANKSDTEAKLDGAYEETIKFHLRSLGGLFGNCKITLIARDIVKNEFCIYSQDDELGKALEGVIEILDKRKWEAKKAGQKEKTTEAGTIRDG